MAAGDYLIVVHTDAAGTRGRGRRTGQPSLSLPLTVTLPPLPDLELVSVTAPASAHPGRPLSIQWTVRNAGTVTAPPAWVDRVYLSADGTLNGATLIGSVTRTASLPVGGQYDAGLNLEPARLGRRRLLRDRRRGRPERDVRSG